MAHISTASQAQSAAHLPRLTAWALPGVRHGFMTRLGGASSGAYHSFNLAQWVGDDAGAVRDNWARWRADYPRIEVSTCVQVHGQQVHIVGGEKANRRRIGDGMVTAADNVALAVFTADCVPVLMVEPQSRVVAALHAGWRGTLANIAAEGIAAMRELGAAPHLIQAALGPSIGPCCFEVDRGLADQFLRAEPASIAFSRPGRAGKTYLDLRAIIGRQLRNAGLSAGAVVSIGPCTRCDNARFFSRRAAGGELTGLQMSFIGLESDE